MGGMKTEQPSEAVLDTMLIKYPEIASEGFAPGDIYQMLMEGLIE